MQTPCVSLLLGVCVLLLSAPTVSAVSLSVGPNLQQFFSGSLVSLSCVDDGQTADGWTVKRTRGGLTEDCGAAPGFGGLLGSYCVVDLSAPNETFWCEDSSGQQSDNVSFSVQSDTTDKGVILEIPALPVRTGSDVILRCRQRNGATVAAYFFIKGSSVGHKPEHIITNIQQADEGLYSCSTNQGGTSPQSSLRVRDPPKIIHPPPPHCPPPPSTSTNFAPPVETGLTCPPCSSSPPPSLLVPVVAGLVSGLLLVLVLGGVRFLCSKLKGGGGADLWSCGGDGCLRRSVCLCFSGLFLLTAAGVCVLLLSALTVSTGPPPLCESVLRLFCHLVVLCPYCISTGLLLYICCSRKTPNKPSVTMETSQRDGGGQGLTQDSDDVTDDVTTEHAF
ncbi:unnamed protein product [Oreochromis niloticus]|nr:unnamed protein product [Mustela putorius furo]